MREEDKKRGGKGEKRGGKARERPSTRISAAACVNPARRFAASREYRSPRHVDSFQSPSEMLYLFARCIKFCISPPPPKTHSRGISLCFPSLFPLSFSSVSRSHSLSLSLVHFIVRLRTSAADELDPERFAELSYYVNRGKMSVSVEDLG